MRLKEEIIIKKYCHYATYDKQRFNNYLSLENSCNHHVLSSLKNSRRIVSYEARAESSHFKNSHIIHILFYALND